ncbi:hypothetical protein ACDH54_26545, partial [Pseudomonas syringae]|uniref:hypothetical protein n=2 Tax=Pseudomonas syringae group TaxID=136849 RepID=UPI003531C4F2
MNSLDKGIRCGDKPSADCDASFAHHIGIGGRDRQSSGKRFPQRHMDVELCFLGFKRLPFYPCVPCRGVEARAHIEKVVRRKAWRVRPVWPSMLINLSR